MVELAQIQEVYYMVAATGVLVAAVFYIVNLRETLKNRKATLTNNLMQAITNVEGQKIANELASMDWKDFEDFRKKYDSTINPDNYVKRMVNWGFWETLGIQYRSGLIEVETVYSICGADLINMWVRFKPVIEEFRKIDYGRDAYENWEYLALEMAKLKAMRDPSWKGFGYVSSEEYDRAFKKQSQ